VIGLGPCLWSPAVDLVSSYRYCRTGNGGAGTVSDCDRRISIGGVSVRHIPGEINETLVGMRYGTSISAEQEDWSKVRRIGLVYGVLITQEPVSFLKFLS